MESMTVGLDGTPPSFAALDWAAGRAARHPCRVDIVTAALGLFSGVVDRTFEKAERSLRDIAPAAEVTSTVVPGRMPDALLHAAENTDLLVIGAHRRRPARSALAGGRPLRTVSRSPIPVVVVPEGWIDSDGPILVGIADDSSSSGAVEFAAAEALATGRSVTLLHAWRMPAPTMDGSVAMLASPLQEKVRHRRLLERACGQAAKIGTDLEVDWILAQENPSAALLMESRRSSLLVIGTHHRGFFAGAFLGSVAQDVLIDSRVPVCVVPAAAAADE